ncbi:MULTISPECIES: hypothetical protein [Streptomyces]|uniref:Secreted protein n=1 Tax=Streptomyces avermitilis TaxID=33903 RepID=A0A4D4MRR9_STRAX|nr:MULTISPECIES: hypothetical protein [Streptomyces]MYT00480.1 hypothetical protein [Streptomyces sp. SID5469]BBJ52977.1 hypothetical protein SAVMC3_56060 [Streptomyces avermitilis]GDY64997.1 hypothetical protein SAV14893_043900 [Streptomyces avermitilis]GDY74801.1 hypothetical protein SAV31267_042860 [Streptomyces avermitilis]GDY83839.1 hypothetical protein SAVCW2_30380 [Streptomyces avermitilis]
MTKRSWNRRLVVVTASVALAGGGLALPVTAMAAPAALQHGLVALDEDPDGVNESGSTDSGVDDTGDYGSGSTDSGVDETGGDDGAGSTDPGADETDIEFRTKAGF